MMSVRLQRLTVSALLVVAVLVVFAPVARYDFIALDDAQYVKNNENINHGFSWPGIKWAFGNVVAGNWHPVTMLSHMADCQLYGLSPGGQHLTNVLLHTANTVLLFWLLLAMTESRKPSETQPIRSNFLPCALTAALFGLHPLHVESVAWISERKDVLSGFFALLTLWCYQRYAARSGPRSKKPWAYYILALLMFSLGLMSKSMLVTLPFVMLLLDFWPLRRQTISMNQIDYPRSKDSPSPLPSPAGRGRIVCRGLEQRTNAPVQSPHAFEKSETNFGTLRFFVLEKIPFVVLAAIFCIITFLVQKDAGAVVALRDFPLRDRLANVMVSYTHYLGKTFWPDSLAMLYPYQRWSAGEIAGSTGLFIGLSIAAIWAAPRRPYVFVGWFWFVGMLIPVIGIVQVGLQAMADHYTYLPLIGIFMAVAWGLTDFAAACVQKNQNGRPSAALPNAVQTSVAVAAIPLIILVACAGIASAAQVRYWKNSETLFGHAVAVTKHNTVAHYILGALYDSQGNTDRAATEFSAAIADDPGNVKALCGLGFILCGEGKGDEAQAQYEAALRVAPGMAKAHFGLAEVLVKEHNFGQAMNEYSLALQSDPDIPEAHYQLAGLYSAKGDAVSAISQLEDAVRLAPDWPLALNNLAWMRATEQDSKLRDGPEAARLAMHAVALTGKNDPSTLDTLAAAYAETGQFTDADTTAKVAVQIANAAADTNLARQIQSRLKLYQAQQPYRE
ncbi:MAG TPA: tetratricopeptide repeat protein [Verrucomicrobiae bacterium]|jgi:tetratricopeptide (TPR) repeat protein|nr:tetratricopeptide repeat protein [Verrucomicrobiae bacterium]